MMIKERSIRNLDAGIFGIGEVSLKMNYPAFPPTHSSFYISLVAATKLYDNFSNNNIIHILTLDGTDFFSCCESI